MAMLDFNLIRQLKTFHNSQRAVAESAENVVGGAENTEYAFAMYSDTLPESSTLCQHSLRFNNLSCRRLALSVESAEVIRPQGVLSGPINFIAMIAFSQIANPAL